MATIGVGTRPPQGLAWRKVTQPGLTGTRRRYSSPDVGEAVEIAVDESAILVRSSRLRTEIAFGKDAFGAFVECAKLGLLDDLL